MRRMLAALAGGALAVSLVGCTADPLAEQYREGANTGFIAADGFQTVEIAPADRTDPVEFTGTTESGDEVSSDDFLGQVLVVNFWYAACGPCIAEAPELEAAYEDTAGADVAFLGVNTVDSAPTAAAFAKDNDVSYPSVISSLDSSIKLAFAQQTPINATPTTLVLDRDGRVAARIIGQLPDSSVLTTLVDDIKDEA